MRNLPLLVGLSISLLMGCAALPASPSPSVLSADTTGGGSIPDRGAKLSDIPFFSPEIKVGHSEEVLMQVGSNTGGSVELVAEKDRDGGYLLTVSTIFPNTEKLGGGITVDKLTNIKVLTLDNNESKGIVVYVPDDNKLMAFSLELSGGKPLAFHTISAFDQDLFFQLEGTAYSETGETYEVKGSALLEPTKQTSVNSWIVVNLMSAMANDPENSYWEHGTQSIRKVK